MIKATGTHDGKPMLILGLSGENVTRLMSDEPIKVEVGQLGDDMPDLVIFLVGGRTEEDIKRDLGPLIGPDTKQRDDG